MLASVAVFAGKRKRALRAGLASVLLALSVISTLAGPATGEAKLSDLQDRLDEIQAELDAAAAKVEAAHAAGDRLKTRLESLGDERVRLQKRTAVLQEEAIDRAAALYKTGSTGVLDVLFNSEDFAALTDNAEFLSQASMGDNEVFVELARATERVRAIDQELTAKKAELAENEKVLAEEVETLQARFDSVAAEYEDLKAKIAAAAPAAAPAASGGAAPAAAPLIKASGGMVCPVAGPSSFVDTWGAPRSGGRSHQGVDMMAAHGTPQVAIVSGTITYAGYSSLGGNIQYLSGDDGNLYIYIHQRENTVTGGRVQAGQVISYVGDTGNAAGTPHLHFEYHPGGGGAVNPYPLVASIC